MTETDALTLLSQQDQLFFEDFKKRNVFARLVMDGLARCYVVMGGEQFVRLATEEERRISAQADYVEELR